MFGALQTKFPLSEFRAHTPPAHPSPCHESFPESTAQTTRDWGKQDLIHINLSLSLERSTQHSFYFTYVFFTLLVQVLKSPNVLSLPLSLFPESLSSLSTASPPLGPKTDALLYDIVLDSFSCCLFPSFLCTPYFKQLILSLFFQLPCL